MTLSAEVVASVETSVAATLTGAAQKWRITEAALVGADGASLPRVAGHVAYWFAWDGYLGPKAELVKD